MMPCREYQGPRLPAGYGHPTIDGEQVLLHRWISEQIDGPLPPGVQVLHHCDNPPCFVYEHLFRGTHGDNMRDKVAKGRTGDVSRPGSRNGRAKLTEDQVREIRKLAAEGVPLATLALSFGITHPHACDVIARRRWRHIP